MCDFNYYDRMEYIAELCAVSPDTVWYELSREALELFPVTGRNLRDRVLSFEYFEKACMLNINGEG